MRSIAKSPKIISLVTILILSSLAAAAYFYQKTTADSDTTEFWKNAVESNKEQIDHSDWQEILENYVLEDDWPGINRFDYGEVEAEDIELLENYVAELQSLDPRQYPRSEQQAYWINLYNALTVKLILDNYPLASITKLGKNVTSFGPWDDAIVTIVGKTLTLNDIEHRILRPIWRDSRIHYAVNCASLGCPNLQLVAFTAANTDELLNKGATDYLAHPRGLRFEDDKLVLSKIFDWYGEDFGADTAEVLQHLSVHAPAEVKERLLSYRADVEYEYDWNLNDDE